MEHLHKHYENVTVLFNDNWMKLDFNQDGHVTFDDLKQGAHGLYSFLCNYDYMLKATEIKSTLYNEAIKYMQREVNKDESDSIEPSIDDDAKVKNLLEQSD